MEISEAVTLRVKELLKVHGLTQSAFERRAGLSHDTLKSIIKKKTNGVTLKTVSVIANGFGLSLSEFLNCEYFNYENLNLD